MPLSASGGLRAAPEGPWSDSARRSALPHRRQHMRIQHITAHEAEVAGLPRPRQEYFLPGGEVVATNHFMPVPQEPSVKILPMKPAQPETR
jgi:hypothetical protein